MSEATRPLRCGTTEGFLHDHANFLDLIRQVGQQRGINPYLVEKDYWLMHSPSGQFRLVGAEDGSQADARYCEHCA